MSVFGLQRTHTGPPDAFDHEIDLIDATAETDGANEEPVLSSESENVGSREGSLSLSRQWTKSGLRKELARRKYAKYQKGPDDEDGKNLAQVDVTEEGEDDPQTSSKKQKSTHQDRLRDKLLRRSQRKHRTPRLDRETFIDVLYENQRGSFFCGIPLYSARSLLPLDPAEWQNSHFQDSPVDIRDAQVPDPSWRWAWRTWYVDMDHDVDEQGWQYSFSFANTFAWHGNHPWYHSFVRRRRWLRKRVKIPINMSERRGGGTLKDAHKLNNDYFTIHSSKRDRDRDRDSSADRATTFRSSTMASRSNITDDEPMFDEIPDIPTLLAALKGARVDREKILAVKNFIRDGGEEIHYLADNMPHIMSDLIHQTSRRQLQHFLLESFDTATTAPSNDSTDSAEQDAQKRLVENLMKAVDAAGVHVNDQAYWSDLKARAAKKNKNHDDNNNDQSASSADNPSHALDPTQEVSMTDKDDLRAHIEDKGISGDDIKGISADAEIDVAPSIRRSPAEGKRKDDDNDDGGDGGSSGGQGKSLDKGKGKETA